MHTALSSTTARHCTAHKAQTCAADDDTNVRASLVFFALCCDKSVFVTTVLPSVT